MTTEEIWKKVRGFDSYEVSNLGNVRRSERVVEYTWGNEQFRSVTWQAKMLKPFIRPDSGNRYCVRMIKNGQTYSRKVHRLVADNFMNGALVDFVTHNYADCSVNNLKVVESVKRTKL